MGFNQLLIFIILFFAFIGLAVDLWSPDAVLLTFNVIDAGEARRSVDWTVLIVIGAALGLGKAVEVSGAAETIGS